MFALRLTTIFGSSEVAHAQLEPDQLIVVRRLSKL